MAAVTNNEMNVYESAEARFEIAAEKLNLEEGLYRYLKYPSREVTSTSLRCAIADTSKCLSAIAFCIPTCAARAKAASVSTRM